MGQRVGRAQQGVPWTVVALQTGQHRDMRCRRRDVSRSKAQLRAAAARWLPQGPGLPPASELVFPSLLTWKLASSSGRPQPVWEAPGPSLQGRHGR